MDEPKQVRVTSGSAMANVEVYPGDTAEQLLELVAPELGLDSSRRYHFYLQNIGEVRGDVYPQIMNGQVLSVVGTTG